MSGGRKGKEAGWITSSSLDFLTSLCGTPFSFIRLDIARYVRTQYVLRVMLLRRTTVGAVAKIFVGVRRGAGLNTT